MITQNTCSLKSYGLEYCNETNRTFFLGLVSYARVLAKKCFFRYALFIKLMLQREYNARIRRTRINHRFINTTFVVWGKSFA